MASRVVFLFYHGIGHINPCFPLARMLEQQGHQVFFAGAAFFKTHIVNEHFSYYPLYSVPFGLGFEKWLNTTEGKRNMYYSILKDRITDRLYTKREVDLTSMLDDLRPDILLLDGTQPTDFIVLYQQLKARGIKAALLHAMFPSHVVPGRPPINADVLPEEKSKVASAVRQMKWTIAKKALLQKIKYLGFNDHFLIDRRLKANKIPVEYQSTIPSLFYFMPRLTSCILAPREFDFPDFKLDPLHHYVGFPLNHSDHVNMSEAYLHRRIEIIQRKKKGSRVIYCSFGTVESGHRKAIHAFLQKLYQVIQTEKLVLILSDSPNTLVTDPGDSIYQFASVPQKDVLTYCDLFITHGGLSSINESIDAGVPMLMYPVHTNFDPKGNSARVAFHGLGLSGSISADTKAMMWDKMQDLLNDPRYKINLESMKQVNEGYAKENSFLNVLKTLSPMR